MKKIDLPTLDRGSEAALLRAPQSVSCIDSSELDLRMISPVTSGYLNYPVTSKVKPQENKNAKDILKNYVEDTSNNYESQIGKKVVLQNDFLNKLDFLKESPNQNDSPMLVARTSSADLNHGKYHKLSRLQPSPFRESALVTETSRSSIHKVQRPLE